MDEVAAGTLLDVFQRNLAVRGVDVDSRFYALGGDSLVAIRVVNEARARSVPITLRDLLVHQSVRGILSAPAVLARLAEAADGAVADPATEAFGMLDPADRDRVPDGVVDGVSYAETVLLRSRLESELGVGQW